MNEEIKQIAEDYKPYGDKWRAELMKTTKSFLIDFLGNTLKELTIWKERAELLERQKEELQTRIKELEQK